MFGLWFSRLLLSEVVDFVVLCFVVKARFKIKIPHTYINASAWNM
jgi:hypothetical protein